MVRVLTLSFLLLATAAHAAAEAGACEPTGDVEALLTDLDAIARRSTENHLELVVGDAQALESALALIRSARTVIRFETFLLNGRHGDALVDALIQKHREGVRVEVLVDPNGLERVGVIAGVLNVYDKNGERRRRLEAAGITVKKFRKKTMRSMTFGVRGEHAKLLSIDDSVALFGGTNFDDEENHDFDFVVRGPAVRDFVVHFRDSFESAGAASFPVILEPRPEDARTPNGTVRVLSTGPGDRSPKDEILRAIRDADESVWLEMYGLTDDDVIEALQDARIRLGADKVRVMLHDNVMWPDPLAMLNSDYPNGPATWTLAGSEQPVDVRLLPSPRGGKVHTKALLIDGKTAYLGSANYTKQEFRAVHNYVGVVEGAEPIAALRAAFEHDWARASDKRIRQWREWRERDRYNATNGP